MPVRASRPSAAEWATIIAEYRTGSEDDATFSESRIELAESILTRRQRLAVNGPPDPPIPLAPSWIENGAYFAHLYADNLSNPSSASTRRSASKASALPLSRASFALQAKLAVWHRGVAFGQEIAPRKVESRADLGPIGR